jgi:hypothetical protein
VIVDALHRTCRWAGDTECGYRNATLRYRARLGARSTRPLQSSNRGGDEGDTCGGTSSQGTPAIFAVCAAASRITLADSYRGCSQHAPNEHLPTALAREALGLMAGIYWDLGEPGTPGRGYLSDGRSGASLHQRSGLPRSASTNANSASLTAMPQASACARVCKTELWHAFRAPSSLSRAYDGGSSLLGGGLGLVGGDMQHRRN